MMPLIDYNNNNNNNNNNNRTTGRRVGFVRHALNTIPPSNSAKRCKFFCYAIGPQMEVQTALCSTSPSAGAGVKNQIL
jgi:hypothetical protein